MRLAYFSVPPPPNANMPEQMVFWVKQLWATSNGATRIFGSGGPENGFFGRILLRHGRTEGRTEKTWTCIGKLSQSRRKKVIVTKCVARTVFPLRTVERRPWSIFYPLKKHKTGRFSPIRSRNQFFHKRDPYPNGKCLLFCQNNVWVR